MTENTPNVEIEAQPDDVITITAGEDESAYTVGDMSEAPESIEPGMSIDENGFDVVVTNEGSQIKLNPAPKSTEQVLDAIGGEGELQITQHGTITFGSFAVMFSSAVQIAPADMSVGFSVFNGYGLFTSPDGWMQMMRPGILSSQDQLANAILTSFGLDLVFEFQVDGTAEFELDGEPMKVVAAPEINDNCASEEPAAELIEVDAGETVATLDNETGEVVEQPVITKVEVTSENGCQVLNVIPDKESTGDGNDESVDNSNEESNKNGNEELTGNNEESIEDDEEVSPENGAEIPADGTKVSIDDSVSTDGNEEIPVVAETLAVEEVSIESNDPIDNNEIPIEPAVNDAEPISEAA